MSNIKSKRENGGRFLTLKGGGLGVGGGCILFGAVALTDIEN